MKKIRHIFIYIVLSVLCATVLYPVILAVILPFQDTDELVRTLSPLNGFTGKYVSIDYIAQYPTLDNFKQLLFYTPEFYRVFWNSMFMVGIILLFEVVVAVPSAWAFAEFRVRGKTILFNTYVLIMLIPFQITMLSQYLVLNRMDLINSRLAVILPAIFSTFPVFLIYRGFSDIPDDIVDSARIDGANEIQVLWCIGIPLGRSGILSCIVFCFLDLWNMVEQPLTFIKDKKLFPMSLYLPILDNINSEKMLAASVITLIPAAFVFIIGQDYLEQGIIACALKE